MSKDGSKGTAPKIVETTERQVDTAPFAPGDEQKRFL